MVRPSWVEGRDIRALLRRMNAMEDRQGDLDASDVLPASGGPDRAVERRPAGPGGNERSDSGVNAVRREPGGAEAEKLT